MRLKAANLSARPFQKFAPETPTLRKYLKKPSPPPDVISKDEWVMVGMPSGLPWKVYQSWKRGELYQASREKHISRSIANTIKDAGSSFKCLARKVYLSWLKDELFIP